MNDFQSKLIRYFKRESTYIEGRTSLQNSMSDVLKNNQCQRCQNNALIALQM